MQSKPKIWIDLDNSPHVPFFLPIIRELKERGYAVVVTARDCSQVCELVELHRLPCRVVGRHYGKHTAMKVAGTFLRMLQLVSIIRRERPQLAVSHASRAQILTSRYLGIPSLILDDYEHSRRLGLVEPDWLMVPEVIPEVSLGFARDRILKYPGIKEDVYLADFDPSREAVSWIGLGEGEILVTVRPPANEAHYHNSRSEELFHALMDFLVAKENVRAVLLPRNSRQGVDARHRWPEAFRAGKVRIPERVVDGLSLIWWSDLVVSGGGTMNREAAALGVPVYSIFGGRIGAVDHYLAKSGRLILIETPKDLQEKIKLVSRRKDSKPDTCKRAAKQVIVDTIVSFLESKRVPFLPNANSDRAGARFH